MTNALPSQPVHPATVHGCFGTIGHCILAQLESWINVAFRRCFFSCHQLTHTPGSSPRYSTSPESTLCTWRPSCSSHRALCVLSQGSPQCGNLSTSSGGRAAKAYTRVQPVASHQRLTMLGGSAASTPGNVASLAGRRFRSPRPRGPGPRLPLVVALTLQVYSLYPRRSCNPRPEIPVPPRCPYGDRLWDAAATANGTNQHGGSGTNAEPRGGLAGAWTHFL